MSLDPIRVVEVHEDGTVVLYDDASWDEVDAAAFMQRWCGSSLMERHFFLAQIELKPLEE